MSFHRSHAGWIILAAVLLLTSPPVHAQFPRGMSAPVNLQGTIARLERGKIQVVTPQGGQWLVDVARNATVMVTGQGDASLLAPGMYVKFRAQITNRRQVIRPIERIQVFTPTPQDVAGAFPVHGGFAGVNGPEDARADADNGNAAATYDVVGRITGVRRGKMVVLLGKESIEAEPAANVQVDLAIADIRLARPGDEIVCIGTLLGSEMARTVRATSIQIRKPQLARRADRGPTAPTTKTPDAQAGEPAEKDQPPTDRLVDLLTLRQGKTPDEQFRIEDDPTEFQPCARRSAAVLVRQFGQPNKTQIRGVLTIHGRQRRGQWRMLTWGTVKVIVDRSQKTRFLAVEK